MKVDFSCIRTVKVHKDQFDAIDQNAKSIMLTCIEKGDAIVFERNETPAYAKESTFIRFDRELIYKGGCYYAMYLKNECMDGIGIYLKHGRGETHITTVYSWEILVKVMKQLFKNNEKYGKQQYEMKKKNEEN